MILNLWMYLTKLRHKLETYLSNWLMLKLKPKKSMKRENSIDQLLSEVLLSISVWLRCLWSIGCTTLLLNNSWVFSITLLMNLRKFNYQPKE
jgi:hypothetical protein